MSIQKQMKEPFHVIEKNKGEFLSAEENELYRKKSVQRLSWEINSQMVLGDHMEMGIKGGSAGGSADAME